MKVLVIGSSGQLGSEINDLKSEFPNLEFDLVDYPKVDITKSRHINDLFKNNKYDYCINCAAYTAVDQAEKDRAAANALNAQACLTLAKACIPYKVTLIHISTDFVFNGEDNIPLVETRLTDPVNYYGLTKLKGELSIQGAMENYFIFRTSWLYSSFGKNFVKTMINLSETKDELNIIVDQLGSPTYARDLARAILKLVDSKSTDYGLYHYSNEGVASWYDFTKAIFEYKGINTPVYPIPTEKYPTPAARPHYSVMDKSKFKKTFKIGIPHWRESLKECLTRL
ncbi:MAG: dTDP-4-dehydrorhamnose reductase [Cyclobacteriaceae bacterium]